MLVTLKDILSETITGGYAVGAFDTLDSVTTEAILTPAEKKNLPVIIMVLADMLNSHEGPAFMDSLINRSKKSPVPVCVHLDHSPSYEDCMLGIRYGCTSVMIDASQKPYEENVALTRKVVEAAHASGVSVEGEIGHVGGVERYSLEGNVADERYFTTVEEALRFSKDTGIDAIAVAIGTVHGVYRGEPKLNLERLKEIRRTLDIPIVIHGGSGLRPEDYIKLVDSGANKINFFTAMSLAGAAAVKKLVADGKPFSFADVVRAGNEAQMEVVSNHLALFKTRPLNLK